MRRARAWLARDRFLDGDAKGKHVLVLMGTGGNAAGGMVCARNLSNWCARVQLFGVSGSLDFDPVPAQQLAILDGLGVELRLVSGAQYLTDAELIVDALVGYGVSGPSRGALASLIRSVADVECPMPVLDVPTGVGASRGEVYEPAVKADATMTLALPKAGLGALQARVHVGELWLADIGVPPELYANPTIGGRVRTPFNESDLIKLSA